MSTAESDDRYAHLVTILNNGWRAIECRHGIQSILQYRNRAETVAEHVWRGRSSVTTRAARRNLSVG